MLNILINTMLYSKKKYNKAINKAVSIISKLIFNQD